MDWISVTTADSLASPPLTRQRSTRTRRKASYSPGSGVVGPAFESEPAGVLPDKP